MNIGFFGDSRCNVRHQFSFIDLISDYFKSNIVNLGVKQGSEERILYELKKIKCIDLAIIFHSNHNQIFLPECERDVHLKINLENAKYVLPIFDHPHSIRCHPKFREKFKSAENFISALSVLNKFFITNDLLRNRFYGSLIQIDQYLKYKKIPSIHILEDQNSLPPWFQFSSGIVSNEIMEICKKHLSNPREKNWINGMTVEGNKLVFEKIKEIVETKMSPAPAGIV